MKEAYKIAVGSIGIDPEYFLNDMSFEAFNLAFDGYNRKRQDSWEQTREVAYNVAKPYLKGNPSKESFMPLQWDKNKKKGKKSTKERFLYLDSKLNKIINNG